MASILRLSAAVCSHSRPLLAASRCASSHASKNPPPPKQPAPAKTDAATARHTDAAPVGASDTDRASAAGKAGADPVSAAAVHHALRAVAGATRPFLSVGLEAAFLGAMRVRELWMGIGAEQVPDTAAKEETIATASAGKETPAVVAFREGGLGFGFSAGGLLFPYFVGVAAALNDLGVLIPGKTPLAGSSAGAIIAACVSSGMNADRTMECCLALVGRLREGGTFQKMRGVVHATLSQSLPDDAHVQCTGNTFVNTTRVIPYVRRHLISEFPTRESLINALLTSAHIPFYFDGTFMHNLDGHWSCDGGISDFIPSPPGVSYATRISCFPTKNLNSRQRIHISPDIFDETWADIPLSQLLMWALKPSDEVVLEKLYEKGRADAVAWTQLTGLLEAASPDPDDWYRYQFLKGVAGAVPPDMSQVLQPSAAGASAGGNLAST